MAKIASLKSLQKEYSALLQKMFETPNSFQFQTQRSDDGSEHVEIIGNEYHLIATERGLEIERQITKDKDELFYWMISHIAFWQGVEFELKNRIEDQDCRRMIFSKQIKLLKKVNQNWAERKQKEIEQILAENPFSDRS
jgi:hypothetical protein